MHVSTAGCGRIAALPCPRGLVWRPAASTAFHLEKWYVVYPMRRPTKHSFLAAVAILVCLQAASSASAQDDANDPWPQEIQLPEWTVVVYQPQPEKLEGDQLDARAAVSVEKKGSDAPVFGAVWFTARLATDRSERRATIADATVTRTRFAVQDEEKATQLSALLEAEIPKWDLSISIDRLIATLETRELRIEAASQISTDPPVILFLPEPAVLITLDGEPRLKREEGSNLMRVINTPFTILLDSKSKTYYLNADSNTWYEARDLKGEWAVTQSVPGEVAALVPESAEQEEPAEGEGEPGPPPRIVVATEPTELISSNGEPEYTPIPGTALLYMSNTDSDVLLHLNDQQVFVLLAGRWYVADSLDGPWRYVPGEELPEDFAEIPEDDQLGTVLYAVPGTELAEEAVLDAQIPQTAAIERDKATLDVEYDGDPEFEKIEDTTMVYAVNTATPVILVASSYYAVDEGVWFASNRAGGPWIVATTVPDVIYTIPPTSPIYHVTFVRIYSSTDEVVYVGYLPGYTGTYVYNTTIVYGTGYYYPGWYRYHYYPRYSTWGFHVRYNPWSGWGFGLSYSSGPFRFSVGIGGWYRGGWWGPGRYHGYRSGYRRGYRHGSRAGYRAGYRAGSRSASRQNLYGSQRNQSRMTAQSQARTQARTTGAKGRANNVYADRDGNVHRRDGQGNWQERSGDGWKSTPSSRSEG